MKLHGYLNIKPSGAARFTIKKVGLEWNEIAIEINVKIPDIFFERPIIQATITVSEDLIPKRQPVEMILNTKEMIEESTGVKIEFKVTKDIEE